MVVEFLNGVFYEIKYEKGKREYDRKIKKCYK